MTNDDGRYRSFVTSPRGEEPKYSFQTKAIKAFSDTNDAAILLSLWLSVWPPSQRHRGGRCYVIARSSARTLLRRISAPLARCGATWLWVWPANPATWQARANAFWRGAVRNAVREGRGRGFRTTVQNLRIDGLPRQALPIGGQLEHVESKSSPEDCDSINHTGWLSRMWGKDC